jgi:pimeloyl-ACP methyl ester carboxylesterase
VTSVALHVDAEGAGPSIVLAHGFGGSARNFRPQSRALSPTHRVVRYDARGHGAQRRAGRSGRVHAGDVRRGLRACRRGFLEHPPHGLAHTLRGVAAWRPSMASLRPQLATVRVPALVVVGGDDRMSLEPSRELAAVLPAGRLVVVDGAGHVVNLADPAAFNAALTGFLEDVA